MFRIGLYSDHTRRLSAKSDIFGIVDPLPLTIMIQDNVVSSNGLP